MMYGWDAGWGLGTWVLMGLGMVLFWGAVVTLVIMLVRRPTAESRSPATAARHATALDILAERFARGEIDEQEFTSRRQALLGHPG